MLANLVRVTLLARMLGITGATARAWATKAGFELIRAPVAGRASLGASPCYVTTEQAVHLIDALLPRELDRRANARVRERVRVHARQLAESTRNMSHERVGGTGLETPPPKPAL
jgi:hypothetical protein